MRGDRTRKRERESSVCVWTMWMTTGNDGGNEEWTRKRREEKKNI